jgi:hypothetical protein
MIDTGLPVVFIQTENSTPIISKENYVNATMIIEENGVPVYSGTLRIRGRGNGTWVLPKKPYKVKLDAKADLFGMGSDKDWVLLANFTDKTLMRTGIGFKLGELLEFPWTPKAKFVELVINGEYLGNYQLAEGVKQGDNRVDIKSKTGFLVEYDKYYKNEPVWFQSGGRGYGYSFKNPEDEDLTEELKNYIKNYITDFENALDGGNFDPATGYQQYIDLESFAKWYLFHEILTNIDPNFFIYKKDDKPASKLFMGPVWDFEWSLGAGLYDGPRPRPANYFVFNNNIFYYGKLLTDPLFTAKVKQLWNTYKSTVRSGIINYIGNTRIEIYRSQQLNFKKWNVLGIKLGIGGIPLGSFDAEVACDIQFFLNHMDWLDQAINSL